MSRPRDLSCGYDAPRRHLPEEGPPLTTHPSLTASIVIPVKDDVVLLRRCLRAISVQDHPIHEVIVVDNMSQDSSAEVARAAGARVLRCERDGIPAASATGYDAATGDVILRLDADCVPSPDWVRVMTTAFTTDPDSAVLTGGARFIDGPQPLRAAAAALYLGAYCAVTVPTLGHLPVFGSNLAFRRSAWRGARSGIHLSKAIHDDLDLAYHFGERHSIRMVPGAEMGMSIRPLLSLGGFSLRLRRGVRTVFTHWPRDFPPARWARLRIATSQRRAGRRVGSSTPESTQPAARGGTA